MFLLIQLPETCRSANDFVYQSNEEISSRKREIMLSRLPVIRYVQYWGYFCSLYINLHHFFISRIGKYSYYSAKLCLFRRLNFLHDGLNINFSSVQVVTCAALIHHAIINPTNVGDVTASPKLG